MVTIVIFESYGRLENERAEEQHAGSDRATARTVTSGFLLGLDRLLHPYGPAHTDFLSHSSFST